MNDSDSDADPLLPLAEEFAERYRRGERPSLTEYTARFPELAERIRSAFPAMVMIEELVSIEDHASRLGTSAEMVPNHFKAPPTVGDFLILREVGRGGMGVVYEAEQLSLGRRVALKVLPGHALKDEKALERFRREARAAARLHHTNIVPVFEVGQAGDVCYYAMQFIAGQGLDLVVEEVRRLRFLSGSGDAGAAAGTPSGKSLRVVHVSQLARSLLTGRLELNEPGVAFLTNTLGTTVATNVNEIKEVTPRAPGSPAVLPGGAQLSAVEAGQRKPYYRGVALIGHQAATALAYAHARGIVHRDVKPSNLLLDAEGTVWITDFGLAKTEDEGLTNSGDILGTLRYMAPERFRGEGDGRADVYALGLTLHELLTLKPAFESADRLQLIDRVKTHQPERPRALDPGIPRDLETIVLKSIEKEPRRRYQSADEMAEDLQRFLGDRPIEAQRVGHLKRAVLWARRRPSEAALVAVGSLAAVALIVTGMTLWYGGQLKKERDLAQRFQYFQHIALATSAWRDGSMGRLEELLDHCPSDHRDHWEWRYLKRQCHAESLKLLGHKGGVTSIDYSRDGARLASGGFDGMVKLWDTRTGKELFSFSGHTGFVFGVAYSSDGTRIASTGSDGAVKIWDVRTGQLIGSKDHGGPGRFANGVAFSPDDARLATAGWDGVVRVWDLATGERAEWPVGHKAPLLKLAYSVDGKLLATTAADGSVVIREATTGRVRHTLQGHQTFAYGVAFSPDGSILATGSSDRLVKLWDVATGKLLRDLKGHAGTVGALKFSPDGHWLASGSGDPSIKLWDVQSGEEMLTIRGHGGEVYDVTFSPDGARLATSSHDLTIKIWDLTDAPEARILRGHVGEVNYVAFHPEGKILASAGADATVKLWDVTTGRVIRTIAEQSDAPVNNVAFSPDGKLVAWADGKGIARLWDLAANRVKLTIADDHGGEFSRVVFRPDGEHVATTGMDGKLRVWEVKTGQPVHIYEGHRRPALSLAYSPDGTYLASGGEDLTMILRYAAGDRVIATREDHTCAVHGVAFSPDGHYLSTATGIGPGDQAMARIASVSGDGSLNIWNATTGELILPIKGHGNDAWGVAFSPDGTRLASASMDRTIKLWDVASGDEVLTLRGHSRGVLGVAFSPDGNLLASAGADGTVRIWDARPWRPAPIR